LNNSPDNNDTNDGAMCWYTDDTCSDSMFVIIVYRYINEWQSDKENVIFTFEKPAPPAG
jgi:hypothetical protein